MVIWLALIVLVLADCAGSLFLAQGMRQVGAVPRLRLPELLKLASHIFTNVRLILGVICMAIAFFMLLFLLGHADISFVIPATALTEPVNMLGSRYILKEKVSPLRWASVVFIGVGVALISMN
jgi:drug/metabolite transporter (DMT)-like permease